jgi:sucrose synthase
VSTTLDDLTRPHRSALYLLMRRLVELDKPLLVRSEIVETFEDVAAAAEGVDLGSSDLAALLRSAQEGVVRAPFLYLAVRTRIARWRYLQLTLDDAFLREVPVSEYLRVKDAIIEGDGEGDRWSLEVDLRPFARGFPRMKEARSIGRGVDFMNRYLSGRMFDKEGSGPARLFEFLRLHQVGGRQLMLNGAVHDVAGLERAARRALDRLESLSAETPWSEIEPGLRELGFEVGWGRDVGVVRETMGLLSDVLEAASPETLARLLGRVPMIFDVVILSPHGYFGQAGVLGKPDTGGQVVYILDQVRALERQMRRSIRRQGLDVEPNILVVTRLLPEAEGTTCDQPVEPILGTENARILRIPFRTAEGEVLPHWISRFEIWPLPRALRGRLRARDPRRRSAGGPT